MSKDFIFRGTDKKGEHSAMCISEKELMELDLIINFRNGFHWIIDIGCRESINNHSMVFPKGAIMVTDGHEDMGKVNSYPYCQFCIYYASMNDHTDEMITRIEKYLKKKIVCFLLLKISTFTQKMNFYTYYPLVVSNF